MYRPQLPKTPYSQGDASYRYMGHPLPKFQTLHHLYPGRPMSKKWHYTGENIPHTDYDGNDNQDQLLREREESDSLTQAAMIQEEMLARHLAGPKRIVPHPAVEPEAVIEDPQLRGLTILPDSIHPNLKGDNLQLRGLTGPSDSNLRRESFMHPQSRGLIRFPNSNMHPHPRRLVNLPRREDFMHSRSMAEYIEDIQNSPGNGFQGVFLIGVILTIAIMAVVLLGYGVSTQK